MKIALQAKCRIQTFESGPVNCLTDSSNKIRNKNIWILSLESVIHKSYFRRKHGLHINTNTRNWTKLKLSFNLLALFVVTDICMSLTMSKSHRFPISRHFGFLSVLTGKSGRSFPWISKFLLRAHSQNFPATWDRKEFWYSSVQFPFVWYTRSNLTRAGWG